MQMPEYTPVPGYEQFMLTSDLSRHCAFTLLFRGSEAVEQVRALACWHV